MAYSRALSRASSSNPASDALAVSQISGCGDSKAGGDVVVTVTLVSVEPPPPPPQAERSVSISRLESLECGRIYLPVQRALREPYEGFNNEAN